MSAAEATLYGAIIAGTFALLGVVIERVMRLTGRLRFVASGWEITYYREEKGWGPEIAEDPRDATEVEYTVAIDLFNGREVPTGLRNVRVEMIRDGGQRIKSHPTDLETERLPAIRAQNIPFRMVYDTVAVLNIPPRQFVHKELSGKFGKEVADALKSGKWKRVEFVAERPKRPFLGNLGKTYRKTITEP